MRLDPTDLETLRPLLRQLVAELVEECVSKPDESRMAYSEAEAAALLGLAPHNLREERKRNRIEHSVGPNKRILYTRQQITNYLNRHS